LHASPPSHLGLIFQIDAYGQRSREEVLDLFFISIATGVDAVTGLLAVLGSGTALDLRRR
jgi:hypothetical protein